MFWMPLPLVRFPPFLQVRVSGRQLQGVAHLMPFALINPVSLKPGSPAAPCQLVAVVSVGTTVRVQPLCFPPPTNKQCEA